MASPVLVTMIVSLPVPLSEMDQVSVMVLSNRSSTEVVLYAFRGEPGALPEECRNLGLVQRRSPSA